MTRRTLLLCTALLSPLALMPSATAAPAPPDRLTVLVKDSPLSFDGKAVVLQLNKQGTATVTWQWEMTSTRPHNVKEDKGAFDSHPGCSGAGADLTRCGFTGLTSFTQTFRKAGTFRYHCSVHGSPGQGMAGTVVVKAPPKAKR